MHEKRSVPWEDLPSLALSNIFTRISITDRSHNVPFVCRSWAHVSRHPYCWASFIAHDSSSSADFAFVTDSPPYARGFADPFDGRRSEPPHDGAARFQCLIARASGGAVLTSVYFFPFLASAAAGLPNDDDILRLIAKNCPNLKHLSLHGSWNASQEAIFEVIHSCGKLELVDFSHSPYFNSQVLGELSRCCPNMRGIRRNGYLEPSFSYEFTAGFPRLELLNVSGSTLSDKDLLTIVTRCKELTYLDIRDCQNLVYYMHIVKVASAKIGNILYD